MCLPELTCVITADVVPSYSSTVIIVMFIGGGENIKHFFKDPANRFAGLENGFGFLLLLLKPSYQIDKLTASSDGCAYAHLTCILNSRTGRDASPLTGAPWGRIY
jgi:hypothetical protein